MNCVGILTHIDCFAALLQVFLTQKHLVLAMEFAAGGDLFQLVARQRGLREEDARWFFQQILLGIDYCHRCDIA